MGKGKRIKVLERVLKQHGVKVDDQGILKIVEPDDLLDMLTDEQAAKMTGEQLILQHTTGQIRTLISIVEPYRGDVAAILSYALEQIEGKH